MMIIKQNNLKVSIIQIKCMKLLRNNLLKDKNKILILKIYPMYIKNKNLRVNE